MPIPVLILCIVLLVLGGCSSIVGTISLREENRLLAVIAFVLTGLLFGFAILLAVLI